MPPGRRLPPLSQSSAQTHLHRGCTARCQSYTSSSPIGAVPVRGYPPLALRERRISLQIAIFDLPHMLKAHGAQFPDWSASWPRTSAYCPCRTLAEPRGRFSPLFSVARGHFYASRAPGSWCQDCSVPKPAEWSIHCPSQVLFGRLLSILSAASCPSRAYPARRERCPG
ncbi:hypothetical protein D3C77_308090 [compost metagenome]